MDVLTKQLQQERLKIERLEQELAEVHQELHNTNSELLNLTIELDDRVAARTSELAEKNKELQLEMSRRIIAEEESRAANIFWQEIFEAVGQMTMIIDTHHNIIAANKFALETLGFSDTQVVGAKCYQIFNNNTSPDDCPGDCPLKKVIQGGKRNTVETELRVNSKSYLVSCTPIFDQAEQLQKIIHIATDISRIKQLERELLQAQKLESLGTLAGGIAHDFNNILSIILGFTSLSIEQAKNNPEIVDNLSEVHVATLRARDLVHQILTFARKTDEKMQPIEINLVAKEIFKMLRSTTPANIKIIADLKGHGKVVANPTQVHQIFLNLATNSIQAMNDKDDGLLKISTKSIHIHDQVSGNLASLHPGKYFHIEVSDNGTGISQKDIDLIFEPYFTTKGIGEGTGLGLAVVHGIIENCGGKIFVKSAPGKGTSFSIYLPEIHGKDTTTQPANEHLSGGSEHIYVIDDELPVSKIITRMLTSLGYTVTSETDSLRALQEISQNPQDFDMVISDMTMPNMSGDNLAKEILKVRANMPIIICTGYSSRLSKEQAISLGIKDFLVKPLDKTQLAQTIRQILDHNR